MVDTATGQSEQADKSVLIDLTAHIVSAYVSHNNIGLGRKRTEAVPAHEGQGRTMKT